MDTVKIDEQEEVKQWFDKTYKNRSDQYLRPVRAYEIFVDSLGVKANDTILDVACGVGRILQVAEQKSAKLYGIDISDVAIEKAKVNVPDAILKQANAESIPFDDNYFDHISCIGSLERMLNLDNVLSELIRLGKPTCTYCFMVRNSDTIQWKVVKDALGIKNKKGHQGAKSLQEWTTIFNQSGFKVKEVLPDQWRYKRVLQTISLGVFPRTFTKTYSSIIPLQNSYEFIFILKKEDE